MSELMSSWRPRACAAWTFLSLSIVHCLHLLPLWYGTRISASDRPDHFIASIEGLSCSGFKNDVYFDDGQT